MRLQFSVSLVTFLTNVHFFMFKIYYIYYIYLFITKFNSKAALQLATFTTAVTFVNV